MTMHLSDMEIFTMVRNARLQNPHLLLNGIYRRRPVVFHHLRPQRNTGE